ncbi:YceI family protein [Gillisia sp. Q332]|uniref:YceI family protein n=1 Tax=Gillisia xinjiangensis TaxID=3384765 RepID=UPI00391C3D2B
MENKIKRFGFLVLFILATFITSNAQEVKQWSLDKNHTSVSFGIKHFFNTVNGTFNDYQGEFWFDANNLKDSKFTFTIPASSIDTNNKKRDTHLRSEDFFYVEKHPNITFKSKGFEKKSGANYVVHGDLTIRGITRKVTVPFEITGEMDHPMKEGTKLMGLSFNTNLDRTDYKVGVGDWASTLVVGDNVNVSINMELNSKK